MKSATISALATALALGHIGPASAEEWTGLHLTFGISGSQTDLRDRQFGGSTSFDQGDDDIAPYAAVGYDWAYDSFTIGVLADVDLGQVEQGDLVSAGKGMYGETDWFATLRARVGMPVSDQMHIYASGGLALMRAGATGNDFFSNSVAAPDQTLKGAVVGLGAEYVLSPGRHLSLEYIYADFEESDPYFEGGFVEGTLNPTVSALRIGYTFRF
jgi:opacity protein-like surface antigen